MASISIPQALQTAFSFERAGMQGPAENIYRQILSADANQPEVWRRLGLIANASGRPAEALQFFAKAIALAPGNAVYYADLGLVYRGLGQLEKAIDMTRPAWRGRRICRGSMSICAKRSRGCGGLTKRSFATAGDPTRPGFRRPPLRFRRGAGRDRRVGGSDRQLPPRGRHRSQSFPSAQQSRLGADWPRALRRSHRRADRGTRSLSGVREIYKNLGNALFRSGHFHEAERCYRDWVARHPGDGTAHRSLGHVLLSRSICRGLARI